MPFKPRRGAISGTPWDHLILLPAAPLYQARVDSDEAGDFRMSSWVSSAPDVAALKTSARTRVEIERAFRELGRWRGDAGFLAARPGQPSTLKLGRGSVPRRQPAQQKREAAAPVFPLPACVRDVLSGVHISHQHAIAATVEAAHGHLYRGPRVPRSSRPPRRCGEPGPRQRQGQGVRHMLVRLLNEVARETPRGGSPTSFRARSAPGPMSSRSVACMVCALMLCSWALSASSSMGVEASA